ncbi:hypothetical protein F5X99DRAFT_411313 [Biscogniauxia marginata]|nr:hypothetical protein F5X99DRAFT_411313 [Biscogniauxia marginata]
MDFLMYTSREGFLSRRLYFRARKESKQLWEQRNNYRRLYFEYVAGGESAERSWAENRAEFMAKAGLTEAELERCVRERYGADDTAEEESETETLSEEECNEESTQPEPEPEPEPESSSEVDPAGLENFYELTDEDRRLIEVSGLTEKEYMEVMFEVDSFGMSSLTRQLAAVETPAEEEKDDDDENEDVDEDDDEDEDEDDDQYDSSGFLKDEDASEREAYEQFYLELFPPPAAGEVEAWQKDATLVCLRLVQALDQELDVYLRIEGVATWLGTSRRDPKTGQKISRKTKTIVAGL